MSDILSLGGAGNDFKHQIIISFLITFFMKKFEKSTYKNHYAIPELSLNPESSRIPDLTIFKKNKNTYLPIVLIEVCNSNALKQDIEKLTDLMNKLNSVKECFVINKQDNSIYRIFRKANKNPSVARKHSKCETFKLDLSKVIQVLPV